MSVSENHLATAGEGSKGGSSTKCQMEAALRRLTESAFDFLKRSVDDLKDRPKYSVVHFATAVELLLKARLMREHWTLVLDRTSEISLKQFLSGECKTVSQRDAIKRLNNACGENIPRDAIAQFETIARHRNRMVHFFHEAGASEAGEALIEEIVREQCLCWFYLERLLAEWSDQFDEFQDEIRSIRWRMKSNRAFLSVTFERMSDDIAAARKKGTDFQLCSGCGYDAAARVDVSDVLFELHCRVCGLGEACVELPCPGECGKTLHIDSGSISQICDCCGYEMDSRELAEILDTDAADPTDFVTPINCAFCSSYHGVVLHHDTFVCSECLGTASAAPTCEWCSERQIGGGDLEFSYRSGCEFCDGHAGWDRDG